MRWEGRPIDWDSSLGLSVMSQPIAGKVPATTKNNLQKQLLADHDLRCRPVSLPSERLNTRATHIQCCPINLGNSVAVTERLPANRLEARLLPGMSFSL
jgi:hypothetical protein